MSDLELFRLISNRMHAEAQLVNEARAHFESPTTICKGTSLRTELYDCGGAFDKNVFFCDVVCSDCGDFRLRGLIICDALSSPETLSIERTLEVFYPLYVIRG